MNSDNLKNAFIELAEGMKAEKQRATELWKALPSYAEAVEEFGSLRALLEQPPQYQIMTEAMLYIYDLIDIIHELKRVQELKRATEITND